jgi:hypothetical protein
MISCIVFYFIDYGVWIKFCITSEVTISWIFLIGNDFQEAFEKHVVMLNSLSITKESNQNTSNQYMKTH